MFHNFTTPFVRGHHIFKENTFIFSYESIRGRTQPPLTFSGPILTLIRNLYKLYVLAKQKLRPKNRRITPNFWKVACQVHKFQILYGGITIWSSNTSPSTPPPDVFHSRCKNITYEAKPGAAVHASVPQAVDRHHDKHLS